MFSKLNLDVGTPVQLTHEKILNNYFQKHVLQGHKKEYRQCSITLSIPQSQSTCPMSRLKSSLSVLQTCPKQICLSQETWQKLGDLILENVQNMCCGGIPIKRRERIGTADKRRQQMSDKIYVIMTATPMCHIFLGFFLSPS